MKPYSLKRVAIVVGEASGDILGSGLMSAIKKRFPECVFEGIGGERMINDGFISHFPMERLAVMGLVEPLKRLPELLNIRKQLREKYKANPPDIFIGIDAPDFNLGLEEALHDHGVVTAHYVSPSVWAWRQGRVKKIARAVDLMLTLFPFEARFYEEHNVNVKFVGHPLADKFPLQNQTIEAREKLSLKPDAKIIALLPGSRRSEVEKLGETFFQTAELCYQKNNSLQFLIPAVNRERLDTLEEIQTRYPSLPVTLSLGNSHDVMAAADAVVMASGTTTLEALLLKKPMVIAYRMAALSFWLLKQLVKSKYIGLPNLLADAPLIPELLQNDASPEKISQAVMHYIENPEKTAALIHTFETIHESIRKNASEEAAQAIIALCESKRTIV